MPEGDDRATHLAWCKQRALEYVSKGDCIGAVGEMMFGLGQHPETKLVMPFVKQSATRIAADHDAEAARRWIDGFQ